MPTTDMTLGTTIATSVGTPKGAGPVSLVTAPSEALSSKVSREIPPAPVDKVILRGRAQSTQADVRKGKAETPVSRLGAVLFAYNSKGDLRIRFMDSKSTVIYQTPPVLITRMIDMMGRAGMSVSSTV